MQTHDSLVVVPPLPRGPAVHAPAAAAAVGPAAPRGPPCAGLQQAVVESVGAGLVVALPLVAAARGGVGGLGDRGVRGRGRGDRGRRGRSRGACRGGGGCCPAGPGRGWLLLLLLLLVMVMVVVVVVVVGRLQGQEVPLQLLLLLLLGRRLRVALPGAVHACRGRDWS